MAYNLATVLPYGSIIAPVALPATQSTFTSFKANWQKTHAIEYYIDVSTNSSFTNFLSGYENLLLGNVDSLQVTGLSDNETYFYRIRAKYGPRSSVSSNVISATTMHGDLFPPVALEATNISMTGFTANWSGAGFTKYYLDVATDENYNNYVPGYQYLDVGYSFSKEITGLSTNTTYYYRVRGEYTP